MKLQSLKTSKLTLFFIKTGRKIQKADWSTKLQISSYSSINQWQKVCERLPQNIFIFVRKAIILQLANNTNLFWRKRFLSSDCGLCNTKKQTQLSILNNCPEAVRNGRYTWRHDTILFTICHYRSLPRWKVLDSSYLLIWPVLKIRKFCLMFLDLILW